jgi:hypothetical protein
LDWFYLALAAYGVGQVITLLEIMGEHPDWLLLPCILIGFMWPYIVVRRFFTVLWRGGPPGS